MKKKGISLIVLIVTIIVVIILAAVVILTLSKNNPIESAKEARFKEDVRTFQDELALTVSKQYTTAGGHRDEKITTSDFNAIKEYIPSFSEKYKDKFIIQDDELVYTKQLDDIEKEYAQNLSIKESPILPKEYQQVEYIESTGTQYIDTKYLNKFQNIKIDFKRTISGSDDGILLGSRKDRTDNNNDFSIWTNYTKGTLAFHIITNNGKVDTGWIYQKNPLEKHSLTIESGIIYVDDEIIYSFDHTNVNSINSMYIFTLNEGDKDDERKFIGRIYLITMFDDKNYERWKGLPCYSKTTVTNADGVQVPANTKGLYDLVEGKFYTNQGNGDDFIAGPDVNE